MGSRRESEELGDVLLVRLIIVGGERVAAAGGRHRGLPFVGGPHIGERQGREPQARLEHAGEILGPLDVARQPIQVIRGP